MSENAALYLNPSCKEINIDCSKIIKVNRAAQAVQSNVFIQSLVDVFVDLYTAKKEMNKKPKSNHIHHVGALAQQLLEHAEAIKRNGVAIQ